jgi:hypothetical protein
MSGRLIAFGIAAALFVGMAGGQQFGGKGGFGKGGGGKANDYFSLANNAQVKTELKISDDQAAKLPDAAKKALAEILDAGQMKRLQQIFLQQKGNSAYLETEVKKQLKITDEQAGKIKGAIDNLAKEQQEMFQSGGFDPERMQELQKNATATIQGALTAAQKDAWQKMVGEPFELKGGFGGMGGKGGKKKKDF